MYDLGSKYIERGFLPHRDLVNISPWVGVGLPAAAIAELGIRSVNDGNATGLTLASGRRVSRMMRPRLTPGSGSLTID